MLINDHNNYDVQLHDQGFSYMYLAAIKCDRVSTLENRTQPSNFFIKLLCNRVRTVTVCANSVLGLLHVYSTRENYILFIFHTFSVIQSSMDASGNQSQFYVAVETVFKGWTALQVSQYVFLQLNCSSVLSIKLHVHFISFRSDQVSISSHAFN